MTERVTLPCGCIVVRHGGYTHTKLCRGCQTSIFPPKEPSHGETWLEQLRRELT
jgi:hypothetical protein